MKESSAAAFFCSFGRRMGEARIRILPELRSKEGMRPTHCDISAELTSKKKLTTTQFENCPELSSNEWMNLTQLMSPAELGPL